MPKKNSFPRIFISYKKEEKPFVENLANLLRKIYTYENVWYDTELTLGQIWWNKIIQHIEKSDIFLYILSKRSQKSVYCRAELAEAQRLGKLIIPIRIDDGNYSAMLGDIQMSTIIQTENDENILLTANDLAEIMKGIVHRENPTHPIDSQSLLATRIIKPQANGVNAVQIFFKVSANVEPNNQYRHVCDTGIFLLPSDNIELRVNGMVSIDSGRSWFDPNGVIRKTTNPGWEGRTVRDKDGIPGSMITWIGRDDRDIDKSVLATRFDISQQPESGYLHLAVYDDKGEYADNQGAFDVTITLSNDQLDTQNEAPSVDLFSR